MKQVSFEAIGLQNWECDVWGGLAISEGRRSRIILFFQGGVSQMLCHPELKRQLHCPFWSPTANRLVPEHKHAANVQCSYASRLFKVSHLACVIQL